MERSSSLCARYGKRQLGMSAGHAVSLAEDAIGREHDYLSIKSRSEEIGPKGYRHAGAAYESCDLLPVPDAFGIASEFHGVIQTGEIHLPDEHGLRYSF